jgi:D-aminoacyl-tRNA deacylase
MRALVQRVTGASVKVEGELVGAIEEGLCVLVGVTHDDDVSKSNKLADKLWNLRIFEDDAGQMNKSAADFAHSILIVSQFTLYGDTLKGRRPSFVDAARPEVAEPLIEAVVESLRSLGANVETGRFRTEMAVSLTNDGPVTLMLEV